MDAEQTAVKISIKEMRMRVFIRAPFKPSESNKAISWKSKGAGLVVEKNSRLGGSPPKPELKDQGRRVSFRARWISDLMDRAEEAGSECATIAETIARPSSPARIAS